MLEHHHTRLHTVSLRSKAAGAERFSLTVLPFVSTPNFSAIRKIRNVWSRAHTYDPTRYRSLRTSLPALIQTLNATKQSRLDMSANEAAHPENWATVFERKYAARVDTALNMAEQRPSPYVVNDAVRIALPDLRDRFGKVVDAVE